jgi:hypothetical protein
MEKHPTNEQKKEKKGTKVQAKYHIWKNKTHNGYVNTMYYKHNIHSSP